MYRIRMDEVRGAVARGAFQVIEAPFAPGARIDFTGTIRYIAQDQNEADTIRRYIELGLRWTTSFGADRTVGFGQLIEVDVKQKSNFFGTVYSPSVTGAGVLNLMITPRSPFCIARRQVSPNLFESDDVIPGGVIKGCVASTWDALLGRPGAERIGEGSDKARPELCRHLKGCDSLTPSLARKTTSRGQSFRHYQSSKTALGPGTMLL